MDTTTINKTLPAACSTQEAGLAGLTEKEGQPMNEHDAQAHFQAQMTANWVAAEIIASKIAVGPRLRYLGKLFRSVDFSLSDLTALLDPSLELPPEATQDDKAQPGQEAEAQPGQEAEAQPGQEAEMVAA